MSAENTPPKTIKDRIFSGLSRAANMTEQIWDPKSVGQNQVNNKEIDEIFWENNKDWMKNASQRPRKP